MTIKRLLTSCFGLGFGPIAPGTWGSLPVAVVFYVLSLSGLAVLEMSIIMLVLILAGSIVCVKFAPKVITVMGKDDPGEVVADEFAGQAVTFLPLLAAPISVKEIMIVTILGFLLFRFFDIFKPWPIRKLEKLPKGWGILLDDLLAGVYALIILNICAWFLIIVPAAQS